MDLDFVTTNDRNTILAAALDAVLDATATTMGKVQLRDPVTHHLHIACHRGFRQPLVQYFDSMRDEHPCGDAFVRRQRVIIDDIAKSPIFPERARELVLGAGARAVQSTPLMTHLAKSSGCSRPTTMSSVARIRSNRSSSTKSHGGSHVCCNSGTLRHDPEASSSTLGALDTRGRATSEAGGANSSTGAQQYHFCGNDAREVSNSPLFTQIGLVRVSLGRAFTQLGPDSGRESVFDKAASRPHHFAHGVVPAHSGR